MTNAPAVRPIILRPQFIISARARTRTHIILPASFVPKGRTAVGAEARARVAAAGVMRLPSVWVKLEPGDRLWVQEEVAELHDRQRVNGRAFYRIELPGGHVPIPGGAKGDRYSTRTLEPQAMPRDHSRYTLEVVAAYLFRAQDVSWAAIKAEGTFDAHQTKGAWWDRQYGFTLPWAENPECVGLQFKFTDANVDGEVWVPDAPERCGGGGPDLIRRLEQERAVRDGNNPTEETP